MAFQLNEKEFGALTPEEKEILLKENNGPFWQDPDQLSRMANEPIEANQIEASPLTVAAAASAMMYKSAVQTDYHQSQAPEDAAAIDENGDDVMFKLDATPVKKLQVEVQQTPRSSPLPAQDEKRVRYKSPINTTKEPRRLVSRNKKTPYFFR
jgi:hypothetical protein